MPDPVQNPQAQLIARQVTASGIAELMRGGSQIGQVTAVHSNGRVDIQLQGRSFQFDARGVPLKEGQFVKLRFSGGRLLLELSSEQPKITPTSPETSRVSALNAQLSQMGLQGSNIQALAQALIQAGIPLDQGILKELAHLLPQAAAYHIAALAFLFSRGLPISPSMAAWTLRLLAARPRIGHALDRLLDSLSDLEKEAQEEEYSLARDRVWVIAGMREKLQRHQRAFRETGFLPDLKEIEALIRQALASPEALLAASKEKDPASLGAAVLRLLQLLLDLKPHVTDPRLAAALQQATENAQTLHEHLAALAFRNLPSETHDQAQAYYVQIPIYSGTESRQMEIAYHPRRDQADAGRVEVRVELSRLGAILAGLSWDQLRLDICLMVETDEVRQLLEGASAELLANLEQHGFHVQSVRVVRGDVPDSIEPERLPELSPGATQASGVDIRV